MKLDDFLKVKQARCVVGYGGHLTAGKTYPVLGLSVPNNLVQVENDNGFITEYDFGRFEPVLESAENPLQEMKLTPEFDAVEPIFKVGNKVYVGLTGKIAQVTEIIDDEVVSVANENNEVRVWITNICRATQENYEMLSKLYPHIEIELPTKQLTNGNLCRAVLDKG